MLPYMPKLVGFQTMVILDPYGITFNAVGVFGLDFHLLFKSGSLYCATFMEFYVTSVWHFERSYYINYETFTFFKCGRRAFSYFCGKIFNVL